MRVYWLFLFVSVFEIFCPNQFVVHDHYNLTSSCSLLILILSNEEVEHAINIAPSGLGYYSVET